MEGESNAKTDIVVPTTEVERVETSARGPTKWFDLHSGGNGITNMSESKFGSNCYRTLSGEVVGPLFMLPTEEDEKLKDSGEPDEEEGEGEGENEEEGECADELAMFDANDNVDDLIRTAESEVGSWFREIDEHRRPNRIEPSAGPLDGSNTDTIAIAGFRESNPSTGMTRTVEILEKMEEHADPDIHTERHPQYLNGPIEAVTAAFASVMDNNDKWNADISVEEGLEMEPDETDQEWDDWVRNNVRPKQQNDVEPVKHFTPDESAKVEMAKTANELAKMLGSKDSASVEPQTTEKTPDVSPATRE